MKLKFIKEKNSRTITGPAISPVHVPPMADSEQIKHLRWCLASTHEITTDSEGWMYLTPKEGKEEEAALRRNQYGEYNFEVVS